MTGKKSYQWYRHHAWGGMLVISILFIISRMVEIPPEILYPAIGVLLVYSAVFLVLTYRQTGELVVKEEAAAPDKTAAKLEKKRLKAEAKARKKGGS